VHNDVISVKYVSMISVKFVVTVATVSEGTCRMDNIRTVTRNLRTSFVFTQEVSSVWPLSRL
jgi:hypothetical protein